MFIFDISQPLTLMLILLATALLIFLAQEEKKSYIAAIPLISFLIIILVHIAQLIMLPEEYRNQRGVLTTNLAIDCVFIFITFFGYLWVDDMECKKKGLKSIDNSLDWFWKNI